MNVFKNCLCSVLYMIYVFLTRYGFVALMMVIQETGISLYDTLYFGFALIIYASYPIIGMIIRKFLKSCSALQTSLYFVIFTLIVSIFEAVLNSGVQFMFVAFEGLFGLEFPLNIPLRLLISIVVALLFNLSECKNTRKNITQG